MISKGHSVILKYIVQMKKIYCGSEKLYLDHVEWNSPVSHRVNTSASPEQRGAPVPTDCFTQTASAPRRVNYSHGYSHNSTTQTHTHTHTFRQQANNFICRQEGLVDTNTLLWKSFRRLDSYIHRSIRSGRRPNFTLRQDNDLKHAARVIKHCPQRQDKHGVL